MLVTIIIPVYNTAAYLRDCLDSLCAQTFEDWEAICVDDGSTDDSPKILDEYGRRDRRIRVVHKENSGVSATRNLAMQMARGDWVGFMDSDDLVERDWLLRVVAALNARSVDLVHSSFKWLFREGRIVERGRKAPVTLLNSDAVMKWGWSNVPKEGMVWLCFYRRAMLLSSGVVFESACRPLEDFIFKMKLLPYLRSMSQIENDGYLYRNRVGSAIHSGTRKFIVTEQILNAMFGIYNDQRSRLADLGLLPIAFRHMVLTVWGNTGSWISGHPKEESGQKGDIRRLAHRVLEPCVNDRFKGRSAMVRKLILNGLAILCGSTSAHLFYGCAFRCAWNARELARRLRKMV